MKWLSIAVLMIIFFSNCNSSESRTADANGRTELIPEPDKELREEYEKQQALNDINLTINSFFKSYKGDFRTTDKNLISKGLEVLITEATAREKREAAKVANSDEPTNKPMMIEGDIFTSLYEGSEHFKIDGINIVGNKAIAAVKFTNTTFKQTWVDEILLIKEDRWLIDNVIYKAYNTEQPNTRAVLEHFISR